MFMSFQIRLVLHLGDLDIVHVSFAELLGNMIFPQAILLSGGAVGFAAPPGLAVFVERSCHGHSFPHAPFDR